MNVPSHATISPNNPNHRDGGKGTTLGEGASPRVRTTFSDH